MNDPLSQLHDILLPDPISWWPLSYSWWVLIFSISALLFAALWFLFDRHKRNAYRREALANLIIIEGNANLNPQQKILQINALLKQVAITLYGRQTVTALNEKSWLKFLKSTAQFIEQPSELNQIITQAYQPAERLNSADLTQALNTWQGYAQQWIKGHHL